MRRGTKPKPTELKKLAGTWRPVARHQARNRLHLA